MQEEVQQAHNLVQSDDEGDYMSDSEQAAAEDSTAAAVDTSQRREPRSSSQRQRPRNRCRKSAAAATQAAGDPSQHSLSHAPEPDAAGNPHASTAARPSSSQRSKGRRGSKVTAAAVGTVGDDTAADAAGPQANGLHVDDALSAAKHAVQELWVPKRKPTPGEDKTWGWLC